MKIHITRTGMQIEDLKNSNEALVTEYSFLLKESQELLNRDRIINEAIQKLGLEVLDPDQIISGGMVKEIREKKMKNGAVVYTIVDGLYPDNMAKKKF